MNNTGIANIAAGASFEGLSKAAKELQKISQMQRQLQSEMATTSKETIEHTVESMENSATKAQQGLEAEATGEEIGGWLGVGTSVVSVGATAYGMFGGRFNMCKSDELKDTEEFQDHLKLAKDKNKNALLFVANRKERFTPTPEELKAQAEQVQKWKDADEDTIYNYKGANYDLNKAAINSLKIRPNDNDIIQANVEKRITRLKEIDSKQRADRATQATQTLGGASGAGSSLAKAQYTKQRASDDVASKENDTRANALRVLEQQLDEVKGSYSQQADGSLQTALSLQEQIGSYQQIVA